MAGAVLIVDDDPGFRRLASRILEEAGLTVVAEAADAQSALVEASASRPDGILVDVGLPDRSGVDLARDLAALEWHPCVVLTSTDPDAGLVARDPQTLPFLAKEDLPSAPLAELLGADHR